MEIINYPEIKSFGKCEGCGAITIEHEEAGSVTMPLSQFEGIYGKVNSRKGKLAVYGRSRKIYTWNSMRATCVTGSCNRCVNGWSTDYCKCGSKEKFEKCHGEPYQEIPFIKKKQLCLH